MCVYLYLYLCTLIYIYTDTHEKMKNKWKWIYIIVMMGAILTGLGWESIVFFTCFSLIPEEVEYFLSIYWICSFLHLKIIVPFKCSFIDIAISFYTWYKILYLYLIYIPYIQNCIMHNWNHSLSVQLHQFNICLTCCMVEFSSIFFL